MEIRKYFDLKTREGKCVFVGIAAAWCLTVGYAYTHPERIGIDYIDTAYDIDRDGKTDYVERQQFNAEKKEWGIRKINREDPDFPKEVDSK